MTSLAEEQDCLTTVAETPRKERPGACPPGPILVAVDLADDSRAALLWASEHAERCGTDLHVLHVLHDPAESPGTYSRNKNDSLEPMADTAERMLNEFMANLRAENSDLPGLARASTLLVTGLPARAIVDEALRLAASLIVVGSRGQGPVSKLLYGSNAERVLRLSPIPVTVVKRPVR